jgi:O-antigen/teichoic acid export membrane protein
MQRIPPSDPEADAQAESVRGILRHSWIYSLAPVVNRLISIALIRLYTQRLPPEQFGIVDLVDVLILIVPQLVGINLLGGLTRFYFEHKDPRRRAQVVTSTTAVLVVSSIVVCALLLVAREPLAGALFSTPPGSSTPDELVEAFVLAVLCVPFSIATSSGLRYLQILKWSRTSTTIQVGKSLFEASLKLWMLFGLGWGVQGFLLSVLIGEAVAGVSLAIWLFLRLRTGFDLGVFRPLLAFSLPLLPVGVVQLGLHYFGRVLLEHAGPSIPLAGDGTDTVARQWVGIFGFGYKIGFLLHTAALAPFMQIWQPHVFSLPVAERRTDLVRLGNWTLAALCALYLPVAIFARQVVDALAGDPAFREAWVVTPIVVLAYLCYASYSMSQVSLMADKRTWVLLGLNVAALGLGLLFAGWWIPLAESRGYAAAALATLAAFAPLAFVTEVLAWRTSGPTRWPGSMARLGTIACASVALALAIDAWRDPLDGFLVQAVLLKAALVTATLAALWVLGIDREGRAGLLRLASDLAARVTGKR